MEHGNGGHRAPHFRAAPIRCGGTWLHPQPLLNFLDTKRLDPLGFGLENFDAIGRWRTKIADQPVDATGEMVNGDKFNGPAEFKTQLLARKDVFARNVSEKMFAYALNRGLETYDMPIVRHAGKILAQADYRIDTLILEIVKSYPFQYRRGTAPLAAQPQ